MAFAARKQSTDMSSRYVRPPEKREPFSARLPVSTIKKLEVIVELWQARAVSEGMDEAEAKDTINPTHVASVLLAESADLELAEFGGLPADEKALASITDRIKKSPKK